MSRPHPTLTTVAILAAAVTVGAARAQENPNSVEAVNASNNPLNPAFVLNTQDYYLPKLKDAQGLQANVGLIRALTPFEALGHGHLLRTSIEIPGGPAKDGGLDSGLGDLTMFDIVVIKAKPWGWGVGPLLVAPTASQDRYGAGKWQAGGAAAFAAPQAWGLFGALATYQQSFAGDRHREDVRTLTVQPFLFRNLPNGFYIQSSGAWSFDLKNDRYYIPVGLGIGKRWQVTKDFSVNGYVEPQYSLVAHGVGVPKMQVFAGMNFSYSIDGVRRLIAPPPSPRR